MTGSFSPLHLFGGGGSILGNRIIARRGGGGATKMPFIQREVWWQIKAFSCATYTK